MTFIDLMEIPISVGKQLPLNLYLPHVVLVFFAK